MEITPAPIGVDGLAVPVWREAEDGGFTPINDPARAWTGEPCWPNLARLMRALLKVPGRASGSYESEGKVHQLLTLDAEDGPLVVMRPIRDGERESEVERRLAEIVHDLNAPLTSLRIRLGALRQGSENEAARRELLHADVEIARLQGVVRNAVALGRLTAHILDRTEVEVGPLLGRVAETLRPIAAEKGVRLELVADAGSIRVERAWIERALMNLGDNAIRHSPPGERVTIEGRRREGGWTLSVRDGGRGISPEVLSGLHEPHFAELPGEKGLAGLGLTLVRRIVSAHGGDLEVMSEEGVGSEFKLTIPDETAF